jgi:hypothetical protein
MLSFELSKNSGLVNENVCPLAVPSIGCSFTRTATADVSSGSNAVTPKTNLDHSVTRKY